MVVNSDIDVEAGRNAGCRTARIVEGDEVRKGGADILARSLLDAVHQTLTSEP